MKKFIVLLVLSSLGLGLFAQVNKYGTPVAKSYSMQITHGTEYNWSITKDKFGSVYFGNDDNQVIKYDGSNWTTIPLSKENTTIARALGTDQNGIIYVGGLNEFGYIEPDSSGKRAYVSLSGQISSARNLTSLSMSDSAKAKYAEPSNLNIGEIQSLIVKDSKVYFLSAGTLIIYNTVDGDLSYINLRDLGYRQFLRIFSINDKIILASNNYGIFEFKDGKILQMPNGSFFKQKRCLSILPHQKNKVVIGTVSSGIFLYDYSDGSIDSSFVDRKFFDFFKTLQVYCGVKLVTGELIYGTLTDGIYIISDKGQYIGHWTSKNTDLLDNVITAIYADPDANSELWIAADGSVTKAYVNLPFTQISEKAGIDGSVNNFCTFNGSLYIATDKGLFRSTTDEEGSRMFKQFAGISSQILPVNVAKVANDSFLLAGSLLEGVYKISTNGKTEILKGNIIDADIPNLKQPFIARSIFQSNVKKNRFYFGMTNSAIRVLEYNHGLWKFVSNVKGQKGYADYLTELQNGDLIFETMFPDGLYRLHLNDTVPVKYTANQGVPDSSLNFLKEYNGSLCLTTGAGIFKLDEKNDKWIPFDEMTGGYTKNKNVDGFTAEKNGNLWLTIKEQRFYDVLFTHENDSMVMYKGGALAILPNLEFFCINSIDGRDWFTKFKSLYIVDREKLKLKLPEAQTLLTKIVVLSHGKDSLVMNETFYKNGPNGRRYPVVSNLDQKPPEFNYKYNSLSFFWTTPYLIQEEDILYSYMLLGYDDKWSNWEKISYKDYTNLSFGKYTFKVKARTVTEIESKEAEYSFIILKPWYLTPWMIILYIIATILSVLGIIAAYTKRLKNENIRLEGIVAERTAVVVKQKEELESSIHYARRIQMALLPSESILTENIKNYFVLFKPRDIVSGDFYWMEKKGDRLYIVAADCTGHGVPGAFMSLLGMSFLDEIIDTESAPRADFILNRLRLHVTESLKQVGGEDEAKDGMDIALLVIDFNSKHIEFSGAYNPCFRVRKLTENEAVKYKDDSTEMPDGTMSNGKYLLETIFASKMPIGISSKMNEDFVFYDWVLEKGISYYLFSDGYIDQFGGEHGRKFMKKNFKKFILEIQDYPMNKQKELLEENLRNWMGQTPQIDDILVMGIRTE
ncbi:MAG: SpoIIE family protein phosphatase [Bacteroidia bacterium]|nr:SpoIIE family protein phosphatase [Bacteroidia bacterium]